MKVTLFPLILKAQKCLASGQVVFNSAPKKSLFFPQPYKPTPLWPDAHLKKAIHLKTNLFAVFPLACGFRYFLVINCWMFWETPWPMNCVVSIWKMPAPLDRYGLQKLIFSPSLMLILVSVIFHASGSSRPSSVFPSTARLALISWWMPTQLDRQGFQLTQRYENSLISSLGSFPSKN